jgi:alkylation response protein AidB-like acyl-CoA dehydrogenase
MAEQTSRLASEQEARDVAEAAREQEWEKRSFTGGIFAGRFDLDALWPPPAPDPAERERADEWLARLERFAADHIDGDAIDRDGWVPDEVLEGLAALGAYGIKIPREYGGLGFSQTTYARALQIIASRCGSTGAFMSAHQSIGVPGPLMYFGTADQKKKYLPRLAGGALSAFALTEADVGSDPANMSTHAELAPDGKHWILNGEKLWCTNGPRADVIVVMAVTPAKEGKRRRPISAFIVETSWPGVEVVHRCDFMGLKGISNGVLRFRDVKVPADNLLWGEGKGLKLALITLNTGRLSLPVFCAAAGKACLEIARHWTGERVQWGTQIGKHDAIAQKIGRMAADTFAMEAAVEITSGMADAHTFDLRLEAAIAKMWNTERAWEMANDLLQIRGGRGYETHASLKARGEASWPVERMVRDLRINLIFEGSSEIMRLFIAREAVDDHLSVAGAMVDPRAPIGKRIGAAVKAGAHYAWWYPSRYLGWGRWPRYSEYGALAHHMRFVERTSRRLARSIFHAMVRFGPALEKKQAVLGRIVEIGAELFMMSAAAIKARRMLEENPADPTPLTLADLFCRQARRRVRTRFDELFDNEDAATYRVARQALAGEMEWLEKGIVSMATYLDLPMENAGTEEGREAPSRTTEAPPPRKPETPALPAAD